MRSSAMATLSGALLVLLLALAALDFATADITVDQTVLNGCTDAVGLDCKTTGGKDYGLQSLLPAGSFLMTVTSTLDNPDLTCTFSSTKLPILTTARAFKIWEYLKSGFIDSPEMSCSAGCFWKTQDDGLYYSSGGSGGTYTLLVKWEDILPGVVV